MCLRRCRCRRRRRCCHCCHALACAIANSLTAIPLTSFTLSLAKWWITFHPLFCLAKLLSPISTSPSSWNSYSIFHSNILSHSLAHCRRHHRRVPYVWIWGTFFHILLISAGGVWGFYSVPSSWFLSFFFGFFVLFHWHTHTHRRAQMWTGDIINFIA